MDLAAKLNNSGRHPSPVYARFISLILEKALGNNYVIYEEITLRIPLMGNSIFNLEPTSSEVLITCHMDRVCKSISEACLVYEDVAGLNLCSCDHNLKDDCYGRANEISNCLNEEVIDQSSIYSGSGDQNIKDDCPGKTIKISNCLSEEVVYQSAIPSVNEVPPGTIKIFDNVVISESGDAPGMNIQTR
ncbi:hypothetical protein Tco_1507409 [Tanacetum coccineum]